VNSDRDPDPLARSWSERETGLAAPGSGESDDGPEAPAGRLVFETFGNDEVTLAAVREVGDSDRWIQSTVTVPVEA